MRHLPARTRLALGLAGLLAVAAPLTGCATTYDQALAPDTAPSTTTTLPTGTTDQILERLRTEAFTLSNIIVDGGDSTEAYDALSDLWVAARPDVVAKRPDLVDGFDRAIAMCKKAVDFKRGADADKAARNLDVLVNAYSG